MSGFSYPQVIAVTGPITASAGKVGYATGAGAGGTISQPTSKSTAVTLNAFSGEITMNAAALAANTAVSFTVNNTFIEAGDVIIVNHQTGGNRGDYDVNAGGTIANATTFQVRNLTGGSLSDSVVLRFAIIKAATT